MRGGHPLLRCARHYRRLRLLRLFGDPVNTSRFRPGVRSVTGHLKTGGELDWANLAVEKQTLVFYMGLNRAPAIREKLIAHGMAEDMPAAIVENGTAVTQKWSAAP